MSENMISVIVVLVGVVPGVLYLVLSVRLQRILQDRLPSYWEDLGRPLIGSFDGASTRRLLAFLWSSAATGVSDRQFRALCMVWRGLALWVMAMFVLLAVLAIRSIDQ